MNPLRRCVALGLLPVVAGLLVVHGSACKTTKPVKPTANESTDDSVEKKDSDTTTDNLTIKRFDVNKDKRPDIWKFFRVETNSAGEEVEFLVRKELDLNSDGKVDLVRFYDDQGRITREKLDLDFDGRFDSNNYYVNEELRRKEMDMNYDGKTDLWKLYEKGKLVELRGDKNYDGVVDYWEYYADGKLDRVGYDTDGDGQADRMTRRKLQEKANK